jgi:hypothetical protein
MVLCFLNDWRWRTAYTPGCFELANESKCRSAESGEDHKHQEEWEKQIIVRNEDY